MLNLLSRPEDLEQVFDGQNPWHRTSSVPVAFAPPRERPLAQILWQRLLRDQPRRFQLIIGPRQVGKTTVIYQTVRHLLKEGVEPGRVWWLRLDHPILMQESLGALVREVLRLSPASDDRPIYLMLDELSYAKDWDGWLKTFYDEGWPVRVAATSSATYALQDRRHESGVGRWEVQYLLPFLLTEYLDLLEKPRSVEAGDDLAAALRFWPAGGRVDEDLIAGRLDLMRTGGFPELLLLRQASMDYEEGHWLLKSQRVLRSDVVERAVYRDIPQSFGVGNPALLERLLYVLAGQITGLLSPKNIGQQLEGMSGPTLEKYLSYLERAFLVFTLPNFSGWETTVQKRGRKVYFADCAVRNATLLRGLAPLDNPTEMGHLLENQVASSLNTLAIQSGVRLHHWRDGKDEVDFIFNHPEHPLAFEVASSSGHSRDGLRALMERHPQFRGACYLVSPQVSTIHPEGNEVGTLPLDLLLLSVGAQARRALQQNLGVQIPSNVV